MTMPISQRSGNDQVLLAAAGTANTVLALTLLGWPASAWAAALGWIMVAISISDIRRFIVPDVLSLPAIPAGLIASGYLGAGAADTLVSPMHLAGMAAGGLGFLAIRQGYGLLRNREGLGLGDVKLAAVAGAWTGPEGLVHVVLIAAVVALLAVAGLAMAQRYSGNIGSSRLTPQSPIAFGAFLAPAIWLVYVLQNA